MQIDKVDYKNDKIRIRHTYLLTFFITMPIYLITFFLIKDLIIGWISFKTVFFIFFIGSYFLLYVFVLEVYTRSFLAKYVTKYYSLCGGLYYLNYKELLYMLPSEKKKIINEALDEYFSYPQSKNMKNYYLHIEAMKYYFKRNKDDKTTSEIRGLALSVDNKRMSFEKAYPYDSIVLKDYYRTVMFDIVKFPIFSLVDILIFIKKRFKRKSKHN